jgi:hypothetical protein
MHFSDFPRSLEEAASLGIGVNVTEMRCFILPEVNAKPDNKKGNLQKKVRGFRSMTHCLDFEVLQWQ